MTQFNLITKQPSWIYHETLAISGITGVRPVTAAEPDPDKVEPSVISGSSEFKDLANGGLFYHIAKRKEPVTIKAIDISGAGAITSVVTVLVSNPATVVRNIKPLFDAAIFQPILLGPNEMVKIVCTDKRVGLFVCLTPNEDKVF